METLLRERVRIQIFGREYDMDPGGLTPLEVQSVAQFVDERMREIADRFGIVDTQKIAVLAALNIALDYLQTRDRTGHAQADIAPRIAALTQMLDDALKN